MIFKTTMWIVCLTFVATVYNVVSAYGAMSEVDVQNKFAQVGLLNGEPSVIASHAPSEIDGTQELAFDEE